MDRSLPDPLAGGSLTAASGDLVAVEGPDVVSTVATPWDPGTSWPPVPESAASVQMDTGSGMVSLLRNGRVVSASGGTSGREVEVEVADQYQTLDRTITWDNMGAAMPMADEAQGSMNVGLHSVAVTDRILRHCGWYATPPQISSTHTLLSVPAMGTMWPEKGRCDWSGRFSDGGGYPYWEISPWGVGVRDVEANYTLAGGAYTIRDRGHIELAAMTTAMSGTDRVSVESATGAGMVRLQWTNSLGHIQVRNSSGVYETAASVSRAEGLLYASVSYISTTRVRCVIRSGGQVSVAESVVVDSMVTNGNPRLAVVRVNSNSLASGFQVAMPGTSGTLTSWTSNVLMRPRVASRNHLVVLRAIQAQNCAELLASQCEAECGTYWIDETGVLQWWDLARLEAQSSVGTLNSDDDISEAGFTWSHSLSQVKSRVLVKWNEPLPERRWRTSVDLWQGSGKTIAQGEAPANEPIEEWISVPDDEVWIAPDITLSRVGDSYNDFNGGVFSWYGGIVDRNDGEESWAQNFGSFIVRVERVTDNAFKMFTHWTGDRSMTQRTFSEYRGTGLWARRMNFNLPIIRGRAKFTLMDQETYSEQEGPPTAPEHVIDAGFWIQVPFQAQYTANFAAARLTVPQPVLSSVALIPIPGLQLGDVVEVRDEHVTRLTIRGIVIEDSRSIDADMGMSHAVAIRPTYVTRNGVTWREWADAAQEKTWAQWATNQNSTWAAWGENPLLKEDVI